MAEFIIPKPEANKALTLDDISPKLQEIMDKLPVAHIKIPTLRFLNKPDWSTWRYVSKARLLACVALSCEVTPYEAGEYMEDPEIYEEDGEGLPIKLCTFRDRLEVAIANLSPNGPLNPISEYPEAEVINTEIYLADFADFAESVNWALPNEFPRKSPILNTDPNMNVSVKSEESPQTKPDPRVSGRRDLQIQAILKLAAELDFDPKRIPNGGKAEIERRCLENGKLFSEHSFKKAWQEARNRNLIEIEDIEKYRSANGGK